MAQLLRNDDFIASLLAEVSQSPRHLRRLYHSTRPLPPVGALQRLNSLMRRTLHLSPPPGRVSFTSRRLPPASSSHNRNRPLDLTASIFRNTDLSPPHSHRRILS